MRTLRSFLVASLLVFFGADATAQVNADRTYQFLLMPASARSAALGGDFISVRDSDLNLVVDNPALLDSNLHQHLTLSYINWLSDINLGYGAYARHFKGVGTFSAGMQYINYGTFTETDAGGNQIGTFTAGEYAADLSFAREVDQNWTVGSSFKLIYSNLVAVNSLGFAFDFGAHYRHSGGNFQAGAVINNVGTQLTTYTDDNREKLPFEIQLAASQKLPKAPLRFTFLASNLQQLDMTYEDPLEGLPTANVDGSRNQPEEDESITADMALRHLVVGAEILASENFHLRLSYNYQRRQEMGVAARGGLTGFSFGLGFKIKKFHISWGLSQYHLAGSSNHFTITTNLNEFNRRAN